jgi:hypothetical protein
VNHLKGATMLTLLLSSLALASTVITTTGDGDRLLMCGKADIDQTNDAVAAMNFEIDYPAGFPGSYWGINRNHDAYVCVGANGYNDSTWSLPGVTRSGAFRLLDVTVLGFKTDALGNRVDVNGDLVADDDDWAELRYSSLYSGADAADSAVIAGAFAGTWGSTNTSGTIALSGYDTDGYPRQLEVLNSSGGAYLTAEIGLGNSNDCSPAWGRCVVWGTTFQGAAYSVAPTAALATMQVDFTHNSNKWVKFDAATDTFDVQDAGLAAFLAAIEFEPRFWVMARDNQHGFVSP